MAGRLKDQKTDKMPGPAEYELGKVRKLYFCPEKKKKVHPPEKVLLNFHKGYDIY